MKVTTSISVLLIGLLLLSFSEKEISATKKGLYSLFKIERSKDNNQIFYDVNLGQTGSFDTENPINVYWIKNTLGGRIEPLTWIQKKYAYGLKYLNIDDQYATFRFVCYNKMFFTLKKNNDNTFEVYTKHNDRVLKMERIYIQIDGGTFWFPNISEIQIYAKDAITNEDVLATIQP